MDEVYGFLHVLLPWPSLLISISLHRTAKTQSRQREVCANVSTRLSSRSGGGGVREGGGQKKGEGSGHGYREQMLDNDELGVSPRQQAASSIIHLSNKLINEVNEEEQRQGKSCRRTGKRHLEAGGTSGILRRILICEVNNKVWTQGQSKAALILEKTNVEQSPQLQGKKWEKKEVLENMQVLQEGSASAESTNACWLCWLALTLSITHLQRARRHPPHHFPALESRTLLMLWQHKFMSHTLASV